MNFVLTTLTIVALSICGPGKDTVQENQKIQKPTNTETPQMINFKKVPTKWVKISKNSN